MGVNKLFTGESLSAEDLREMLIPCELYRLEKYQYGRGMNPTRRFVLALLKYPLPYSVFELARHRDPSAEIL